MKETKKLTCDVCKKEIPTSVVLTMEGADYVHHFCCQDCMDHYFKVNPAEKPKKKS